MRAPQKKSLQALRGRGGFTLLEILFSMGIFAIIVVALLSLQYASLMTDRAATTELHGTVALRSQLEQSLANAYDNRQGFDNVSQGMLAYLNELANKPDVGPAKAVNVERVGDTMVYTFPVSSAGASLFGSAGVSDIKASEVAVGTLTIFLNEKQVPEDFSSWVTIHDDGTFTNNPHADSFDMNANRVFTDNFAGLIGAGDSAIAQTGVSSLPIRGEIRYYNGTKNLLAGQAAYTVARNYIVNDSSMNNEDYLIYTSP